MGAQIGFALGSYAGAVADPTKIQGPTLGDLPVQTAMEGAPRPIVYGRPQPFFGNLLQSGDYNRFTTEDDVGKGATSVQVNEHVTLTYAIRICEGPATVIRAWRDERLVYDATNPGSIDPDMYAVLSKTRFYSGDENQFPDPSLESLPSHRGGGVGNVPAYRGTAYAVITEDDLTQTGGRIPQWKFEMASNATVTETCGDTGTIWHFPLSDAVPGGIATEIVNGWDGEYGNDSDLVSGGSNLHALGQGSVKFTNATSTLGSCMLAQSPVDETHPFSMAHRPTWTIMLWFRVDDEAGGSASKNLAALWGDPLSGHAPWRFCLTDAGTNMTPTFIASWGASSGIEITGSPVTVGGSHFLAATYDNATELCTFYQDGIAVGSDTVPWDSFDTGGENAIEVGGGAYYPGSSGFNGAVQDLKAFDICMSPEDIFNRFVANPDAMREAPDVPGTFVRRTDRYTVSLCTLEAEISSYMLSDAITDICRRVGISSDQLDVSADTAIPIDYLVGRAGLEGSAAILPLAMAYFRDYVDTGLLISSVPRGGSVVEDLTSDDFLVNDEEETTLRQKIELPRRLNLAFWDREANARLLAFAERESQNVPSEGAPSVELPLVLNRDIATQKAHILQKIMAEEAQGRITRALPYWQFAHLMVSNPITVDGKRHRIEKAEVAGGRMDFEAVRDRVSNYSSNATAGEVIDPATPPSSLKGPTWFQALNLPRLTTAENQPGMYVAATGATDGWPGAYLKVSYDQGATFQDALDVSGHPITFGRRALMGHLVDGIDSGGTDSEPVTIQTWDLRDIASVTDAQLAARQNAFAVTTDGVSEIIQIKDAEESDSVENEFACTNVDRGLLNTTATSHNAEDEVLALDGALKFAAISASYVGQEIIFWPITRGTPPENNPKYTVTFEPLFTGPATVAFLQTISGEYAETIDGFRIEALSQ